MNAPARPRRDWMCALVWVGALGFGLAFWVGVGILAHWAVTP